MQRLSRDDENHRLESYDGEIPFDNYLKIDNSDVTPEDAAKQIKDYFRL